jgi:hypothetical protein
MEGRKVMKGRKKRKGRREGDKWKDVEGCGRKEGRKIMKEGRSCTIYLLLNSFLHCIDHSD